MFGYVDASSDEFFELHIPELNRTNCSRDIAISAPDQRFSVNELLMCGTVCLVKLLVVLVSMLFNAVLNGSILVLSSYATSNFVYYCFFLARPTFRATVSAL